jgi:hypothetical protein
MLDRIAAPMGSFMQIVLSVGSSCMRTSWPTLACAAALSVWVAPAVAEKYRVPRLVDGRPDLQGVWDHVNATPLERLPGVTTLVITPDQATAIARALDQMAEDRSKPTEPTEYFNERSMLPIRGELRSSIIVDPPDGRIPGTPAFKEWQVRARAAVLNALDGPEQRPTSERCLGNPAAQPPALYNPGTNLRQIVQTPHAVVIVSEVMHFARIVRVNATHAPAAVTSWEGDSIGWWEGDTLVVETKHFTPSDIGRIAGATITFQVSPGTTVTERITRMSDDELNYVFTVDDPAYYLQPWTGETHLMRTNDNLLEYACHEANYSMRFILQGGRARDAE